MPTIVGWPCRQIDLAAKSLQRTPPTTQTRHGPHTVSTASQAAKAAKRPTPHNHPINHPNPPSPFPTIHVRRSRASLIGPSTDDVSHPARPSKPRQHTQSHIIHTMYMCKIRFSFFKKILFDKTSIKILMLSHRYIHQTSNINNIQISRNLNYSLVK